MVNSDPIYMESRKETIENNIQRADSLSSGSGVTKQKGKESF